jgi:sec-independent protein translocase protein TatA
MTDTLALSMPGMPEMILLAALGLLIFGRRLPEVGRNIGKGIVEFKRGLKEAEQSLHEEPEVNPPPRPQQSLPASSAAPQIAENAPKYKFDPYTGKPIEQEQEATSQT